MMIAATTISWPGLIAYLLSTLATGALGAIASRHARSFCGELVKFADVVLLLGVIVATIVAFARIDRLAAVLLVPYVAWVAFATALTYSIWRANIDQLSP